MRVGGLGEVSKIKKMGKIKEGVTSFWGLWWLFKVFCGVET